MFINKFLNLWYFLHSWKEKLFKICIRTPSQGCNKEGAMGESAQTFMGKSPPPSDFQKGNKKGRIKGKRRKSNSVKSLP